LSKVEIFFEMVRRAKFQVAFGITKFFPSWFEEFYQQFRIVNPLATLIAFPDRHLSYNVLFGCQRLGTSVDFSRKHF